jgi:molecular chaperone DnaK (HSP70)
MPGDEHFYLGIDLGTTYSSIHWGALNPNTKLIEPKELSFDQYIGDGSMQRRTLQPSFIYFRQDDPIPIVGEHARTFGLRGQPSRVARSIKSHLGDRDWQFEVDDHTYSAAELSAILLRNLFAGIRNTWDRNITDVVITVPASFDSDMREDTLAAARLAGFKTNETNGTPRNLLLDEPRASLYDLVNQQRAGLIPPTLVDFTVPKNVLVFDLGGGTLDVSLHRVVQDSTTNEVRVDDLAISRYTQLGGDVFDSLVADELQRRFEERHKMRISGLPPSEQRIARFLFEAEAEQAKRRLTTDIEQRLNQGAESIPDDFGVDIHNPYMVDNKGLFTRLTKRDFNTAIAPLMGVELTLADVAHADELDPTRTNNIIGPVLDVLRKAQRKCAGEMPSVDTVVLSGGMTRVHAIRDRLQAFFGIRPLTVLNPDLSVSRGAAIYHHMLHRGVRAKQILAESIGLEVHGNKIHTLIPAGTVLPTKEVFTDLFEVPYEDATVIRVPLYRGEGPLPASPNKRIVERRLVLSHPQPAGAPLDVEVSVDENKVLRFVASLRCSPSEKIEVISGAESTDPPVTTTVRPPRTPTPPSPFLPTGSPVDISWMTQQLRHADERKSMTDFKALEPRLVAASNSEAVVKALIGLLSQLKLMGMSEVLFMLGEIGVRYPTHPCRNEMIQACLQHIRPSELVYDVVANTKGKNAIIALGKIGSPLAESALINLLKRQDQPALLDGVITSLGKCGNSVNALQHVSRQIDSDLKAARIVALWAVGRLGSRERAAPLPISELTPLVPKLLQRTDPKREPHGTARANAIYALSEVCDRRAELPHRDVVSEAIAAQVIQVLTPITLRVHIGETYDATSARRFAGIAIRMASGETLTAEEQGALMAVRSLISVKE